MLVCNFKKKLKGFSLDIDFNADSCITALMGASGSGKSMTLRCIAGISTPDSGRIELNGKVLFDSEKKINLPPQKRNTGFLFQDYALFPNMTVKQNIITGMKTDKKINMKKKHESVVILAKIFHIAAHLEKFPHQLSGGEKQRCALARIFAGSPEILMLDEPFASLDSHLRWKLEVELAEILNHLNKPILYVSHNRSEIFRLCNNIIIINNGKNEAPRDKHAVFKYPETVHAARLTGCKNIASAIITGENVSVPDWGIKFNTKLPLTEIKYIGIRANNIMSAYTENKYEIAAEIPYEIVSEIEDTFTSILMVRKKGTDLPAFKWEMPKKERLSLIGRPPVLVFLYQHILFLKGDKTMNKIAVFTNRDSKLCDFFEASRFLTFEREAQGGTKTNWIKTSEVNFEKIVPSTPAITRNYTEALLPLVEGCNIIAGGALFGIPFTVFDRAGMHIFEIKEINNAVFDDIAQDLCNADAAESAKKAIIRDAKPVETETPGVYFLDLIALQKECPEISSKKAMMDFLKETPFLELRLVCKHIPPWIENSGEYNIVETAKDAQAVHALITRKC